VSTRSVSRALLALLFVAASAGVFAAGCGVDNALVGGSCAAGYAQCGLHCVKLASDPENCGACGHACRPGSACTGGTCDVPLDASTDAPLESESAADAPAVDESHSTGDDGSIHTSTGDAGYNDAFSGGESAIEPPTVEASVDEAQASADDAAPDGGTPVDPTGTTDAGFGDDGSNGVDPGTPDSGTPDSAGVDSPSTTGDDSSAADSSAVDSAYESSTPGDSAAVDATPIEAGNPCTAPLVYCGGACIDVTGDPLNCGACNVVCASQLCDNSQCVGATSGGIVYIGHDYTTTLPGTAQARVLSNAVFVPASNPLHVMSYERYARVSAVSHVDAILNNVARQEGRTLSIASTTSDDVVRDQLVLPSYDVLLIHDQPTAPDAALAALGAKWASTLSTFTLGGGVVIVLDGGGGIAQMPALATGTALLSVGAHFSTAVGTPLLVTSHVDVIGIGVISPYGAGQSSVSLTTEANGGNVVYVVEIAGDGGSNAPVVVHKAF
jgi:hypothetical protein